MVRRFILSPCGTSLLTNRSTPEQRKAITDYANAKTSSDILPEALSLLADRVREVQSKLAQATVQEAARLSAELNGILKFYDGQWRDFQDHHCLLCTDTWLGEQTARLVESWLRQSGFSQVEIRRQTDLQTARLSDFQLALSDLVKWAEETIPGYRQSGYRIVFNLTGGFKSVQGFLQTLATFYADETIYIFESATDVLRIPRLPVRMEPLAEIRDRLMAFRRLAQNLPIQPQALEGIAETLLLKLDDQVDLSPWGTLIWNQTRSDLYREGVHPAPSSKIHFSKKFEESVQGLPGDRLEILNHRLDQLACYLEKGDRPNPKSLDFKKLGGNPRPPSTHEIDAWSDLDAKRLFGHFEGDVFVLDELGKHL